MLAYVAPFTASVSSCVNIKAFLLTGSVDSADSGRINSGRRQVKQPASFVNSQTRIG